MSCINPNTPEYKKLLTELKNPLLVEIALSKELNVKPGVEELFESNPELANAVYEALGFSNKLTIKDWNEKSYMDKRQFVINELPRIKVNYKNIKKAGILSLNNPYILDSPVFKSAKSIYEDITKGKQIENVPYVNEKMEVLDGINRINAQVSAGIENIEVAIIDDAAYDYINKRISEIENNLNQITPQQKQQAQQLYSQYLDSIFPDSKVKDIVYHSTPHYGFNKFSRINLGTSDRAGIAGFDFLKSKKATERYLKGEFIQGFKSGTYAVILNTTSPLSYQDTTLTKEKAISIINKMFSNSSISEATYNNIKEDYINSEYQPTLALGTLLNKIFASEKSISINNAEKAIKDFITITTVDSFFQGKTPLEQDNTKISVFEPEQIHILGNKQDIEGFKKFVAGKTSGFTPLSSDINTAYEIGKELESMASIGFKNIETVEEALFEVAQQMNSSEFERESAISALGETITNIAIKWFPDAKVGDVFKSLTKENNIDKTPDNSIFVKDVKDLPSC